MGGKKKIDLFELARIMPDIPIEEQVKSLAGLVAEGKFDHIGMSECSAKSIRAAVKVDTVSSSFSAIY